jgi:hypothetical protein
MFTSARLADPQLRMLAATPMYCQQHITGFIIDIDDDVRDQRPQQLLPRAHADAWCMPRR